MAATSTRSSPATSTSSAAAGSTAATTGPDNFDYCACWGIADDFGRALSLSDAE
jgi:hypothetical protein